MVVVLCGMNDLKKMFVKPLFAGLAFDFRSNLKDLIEAIQKHAPNTKIIFPAIPYYKLDQESVINIFPLSFFLDIMISLWDWQKKRVADASQASVMYLKLSGKDVGNWYRTPSSVPGKRFEQGTLLSADGVHPNSRAYALWGTSMAEKLCKQLQ